MGWFKKTVKKVKHAAKAVGHYAEDVAKGVIGTVSSGFQSIGHTVEVGYNLAKGDLSGAGKSLSKAVGDVMHVGVGIAPVGILVPKLPKMADTASRAVAHYVTGNFNAGSQQIEKLTGFDLDNSKAKAAERAAQAEYQRQVDEANAAAQRNRRANLLATRKSLTPSLSKSSQGGAGGSNTETTAAGGIILG